MAMLAKNSSPARTSAPAKTKAAPHTRSKTVVMAARAKAKPAKLAAAKTGTGGVAKTRPAAPVNPAVPEQQRQHYIEVAAYYIAERRGFFGASALEDWTQAEAEVDQMLREGKLNP